MTDDDEIEAFRAGKLETEFIDGTWEVAGEYEPAAVVTWASEPSPETGHIGWCWWAQGKMGEARGYEDAKRAAEDALRKIRK